MVIYHFSKSGFGGVTGPIGRLERLKMITVIDVD